MAAIWVLTFKYIKKYKSVAADTLCLMSMFKEQAIPESILSSAMQEETEDLLMERTLGVLQGYSMISLRHSGTILQEKQSRSFDIHRLVRLIARNWLTMTNTLTIGLPKPLKHFPRVISLWCGKTRSLGRAICLMQ